MSESFLKGPSSSYDPCDVMAYLAPAGMEKCHMDRFPASFILLFGSFTPPMQRFSKNAFKDQAISYHEKGMITFINMSILLMLRHGLIIVLKNHSCFPWKSQFHVFGDPRTPVTVPTYVMLHPHGQLGRQREVLIKLSFLSIKEKKKMKHIY